MEAAQTDDRRFFIWGLTISLALHALAGLLLIDGISGHKVSPSQAPVEVELVPLPEPLQQEPLEENEQVQAEEPEEPQQPKEVEEAPAPEPAPPASQELAQAEDDLQEVPILQPVEQFGEEDIDGQSGDETGPLEGAESEVATESEEEQEEPDPAASDEPVEQLAEEDNAAFEEQQEADVSDTENIEDVETEEDVMPEPELRNEADLADNLGAESSEGGDPVPPVKPETLIAAVGTESEPEDGSEDQAVEQVGEDQEDFGAVGQIETSATPGRKPPAPVVSARASDPGQQSAPRRTDLLPARELFSGDLLNDARSQTAMRGMSAGQRLNLLCMTELRAQLTIASPVPPELLPSFRPQPGRVLEPRHAAFRSLGRWFDVAFRCEVDSGVTRVENFSFKIGAPIPPSEWLERGLTGF